jgi:hypothetical protein
MPSDREYLLRRLEVVEKALKAPPRPAWKAPPGDGEARARVEIEARLLRKVIEQVPEGQVLRALQGWRRKFDSLRREAIAWEPDHSPAAFNYRAADGHWWTIDACFTSILDDSVERLQRWLESGDDG